VRASGRSDTRNDLLQQLKPLRAKLGGHEGHARHVATRSRQAGDETLGDWIGASRHDDRDRAGCLFRGLYQRVRPGRDDDIDLRSDQLLGEIVEQLNIQFRGAILDGDRLAFDPAQLAKTGEEGGALRRGRFAERSENEVPKARDLWRLLCFGRRQKTQADSENDREPDQPHGHLGGVGWRESSRTLRRLSAGYLNAASVLGSSQAPPVAINPHSPNLSFSGSYAWNDVRP
jgi:hypothetical protein